ncbi:6825_t:CDS:1, partial [Acaulospora morrowiae]
MSKFTTSDSQISSNLIIPVLEAETVETHSFYQQTFKKIANFLLFNTRLLLPKNQVFTFLEIEFYLRDETHDHDDPYSHGHEHQLTSGEWYFHHVGKVGYRGGTRKGVDITFGSRDRNIYGGILIRSIRNDTNNQVIEGPSLVVDKILECCGVDQKGGIREMVEIHWKEKSGILKDAENSNGLVYITLLNNVKETSSHNSLLNENNEILASPYFSQHSSGSNKKRNNTETEAVSPYFPQSSPISRQKKIKFDYQDELKSENPSPTESSSELSSSCVVYNSPRVGLTLSNTLPSPEVRLRYILKPYRFMIFPHLLKKGKAQLIVGLHDEFNDVSKVAEILRTNQATVVNHVREVSMGMGDDGGDVKSFLGIKNKGSSGLEYCRMVGV